MTTSPVWALQRAIHARLSGDAELTALLGGAHVHDAVPRGAAAPYVHLGEGQVRDWSTATEEGAETRLRIVVWSEESGRRQALVITGRVAGLLHDAALPLDGHRLVNLRVTGLKTAKGGGGRRAVVSVRAVTEPEPDGGGA